MIVRKENSGKRYVDRIFASAGFRPTKMAKSSAEKLKVEEEKVARAAYRIAIVSPSVLCKLIIRQRHSSD